jgi:hydrogenase maturation protein HypF
MSSRDRDRLRGTADAGREIRIRGTVQGVGFRPWVFRLAHEHGIAGSVRNDACGVTIEAFGSAPALKGFLARLEAEPPPAARITALEWEPVSGPAPAAFEIAPSQATATRRASIPPDIATCPECLAEVLDPRNRRYHYAFINCTNCGPRLTIARAVPYDRWTTSMAPFNLCAQCRAEYETVADRRFHAEANACPACGPKLRFLDAVGNEPRGDAIGSAARAIDAGLIVAIKGLGGFHLACDATSDFAVTRLRRRKRRERKPFAVMIGDLVGAERLGVLDRCQRNLLISAARPIVLARRRVASGLADGVAPDCPMVGLMFPYTALHHLLMAECARPLVMTSGNLSEEPIAYRNEEARRRLSGIADAFLMHDREIVTRCEDSIARSLVGRPVVLRRSRGYVPRPLGVKPAFPHPVLACGAQLKNTFCLGVGEEAYLGPHVGDLDNAEAYLSLAEQIARMEHFLGVQPEVVAHDLHPDYLSTRYAMARRGVLRVGVQHHHAHVASAMAEHGLEGPVLGLAYDGTGYGLDGAAWGGELLLANYESFERIATFRPLALPGGDTAIRQVWRVALAALVDAFDDRAPLERLALFRQLPPQSVTVVRRMIAGRFNSPLAHGVGRYFDAIGAMAFARPESHYEGQIATMLEFAPSGEERGRYGYAIDRTCAPWQIDLRVAVRETVADLLAGREPAVIAARFHRTLAEATAAVVQAAAELRGRLPVVLTGGCFQNELLTHGVQSLLGADFELYTHGQVPPGDGGIALGQAMVAAAQTRRSPGG